MGEHLDLAPSAHTTPPPRCPLKGRGGEYDGWTAIISVGALAPYSEIDLKGYCLAECILYIIEYTFIHSFSHFFSR